MLLIPLVCILVLNVLVSGAGDRSIRAVLSVESRTLTKDWPAFLFDRANTAHNPFETILGPLNVSQLQLDWDRDLGAFMNLGASPSLAGSLLYAAVGETGNGRVYALDPTTGEVRWVSDLPPFSFFFTAPVVAGGILVVGSADSNVYALDAATGHSKWSFDTGFGVFSSPKISRQIVYVGSNDDNLYALSLTTGKVVWQRSLGYAAGPEPVAVAGGVVYVSTRYTHMVFAFDASTGRKRWSVRLPPGEIWSGPALDGSQAFVTTRDGVLVALDAKTGAVLWHTTGLGENLRYPAVADGVVYVGGKDNKLSALDAATGTQLWATEVDGELFSPIVANGVVYVGGRENKLYAFDAATGELLWTAPAGGLVGNPILVNGHLYFGSFDNHLYAYALPDSSN